MEAADSLPDGVYKQTLNNLITGDAGEGTTEALQDITSIEFETPVQVLAYITNIFVNELVKQLKK